MRLLLDRAPRGLLLMTQLQLGDHRAADKPKQRGRWSWAFMRRDTYDGPGRKWTQNRFLIGQDGNPMMARWRLLQTPLFGVYLHFIYREDLDPVPHDHPWWFCSLVLRGGYVERLVPDARLWEQAVDKRRWRRSLHAFRLRSAHRIVKVDPGTVTLVLVGPKVRTWGFYGEGGVFIEWDRALGVRPTEGTRSTGKYSGTGR